MLSDRVETHFTGRPMRRAAHSTSASSGKTDFQPEAAADVRRDDADLIFRDVEDVRHLHARAVRVLAGRIQRVLLVGRVVLADRDAGLHGHRRQAVVLDPQLHHVLGLGEGRVGGVLAAEHQPEADIALRAVFPNLGCAILGGFLQIHDRGQRLVVHLHELGGITRLRERLGHDEGDAIADEAHFFGVEHRLEGAVALGRAEIFRHQMGRKATELVRHGVGTGQDAQHPGRGLGLGHVDARDARVRVRRQDRHAMAQAR